jgi:enoyl-CoA hydratase
MNVEHTEDVALLRLEAGKANAMDLPFLTRLDQLLDGVDPGRTRSLVLTGYDRFFCAGLSLPVLVDYDRRQMTRFIDTLSRVLLRLFSAPYPVVAAVNGHAIAGGCALALLADLRLLVDAPVQIGLNEVQLGIGLPHIIVETVRSQLSPRAWLRVAQMGHLFSPREAHEFGLVHEMAAPATLVQTAIDRARNLGAINPLAYRQVKLALRQPAIARLETLVADNESWLDTWFSDAARQRMAEVVERLARRD